jgi:hypothetical protein
MAASLLEGSRFRQARQMFPHAVVLGVLAAADGQLTLNPQDELRLAAGDRLLGFTRQGERAVDRIIMISISSCLT